MSIDTTSEILTTDSPLAGYTAEQIRIALVAHGKAVPSKAKKADLVGLATQARSEIAPVAMDMATLKLVPVTPEAAPAKPAKKAAAKKAPAKVDPTKLTTEQKRLIGQQIHQAAQAIAEQAALGQGPLAGLDAGLVAEQVVAWLKYIPKAS